LFTDEKLPDRNGKHGEVLCAGIVPDLEWIAGAEVETVSAVDGPNI